MDASTITNSWQAPNLVFWLLTIVIIASSAVAALSRNIVRAAFSLFFTLFALAGYYALLGSDFLAITQVIIYIGGILVLLMFGILLTSKAMEPVENRQSFFSAFCSVSFGILLFLTILLIVSQLDWSMSLKLDIPRGSTKEIGLALLSNYGLAFLFSALTLLFCLVGAAYLVRRREQ